MNADVFHVLEQTGVWKFNIAVIDYAELDDYKESNPDIKLEFFDRFSIEDEDIENLINDKGVNYEQIFKIK